MANVPLIAPQIDSENVSCGTVQTQADNQIVVTDSSGNQLQKFNPRSQEYLYHYSTQQNITNQYIHFKTNIPMTAHMLLFKFLGYEYQASKPIDANLVLYAYASTNTVINVGFSGSHTCGAYKSSDGFVVIIIFLPTIYYCGFRIDAHQYNPIGVFAGIEITAATNSSNSTGVY